MPEDRPLTVKEKVLAALTKEGQSYKDLQDKIENSPAISGLNLALRKLEKDGLAIRERITKRGPGYCVGISVDRKHMPRVLWRLK
jgi:DNA-binding HxlR family transcriptional regulator